MADTTMGSAGAQRPSLSCVQRDRPGEGLVDIRRVRLLVLVGEPHHPRPVWHVLCLYGSGRPGDRGDPAVRHPHDVPGDHLRDAGQRHAPHGRRLCVAESRPGRRARVVLIDHRVVVHSVSLGADLRQHPRGPVLLGLSRTRLARQTSPRSSPARTASSWRACWCSHSSASS
jgi:hypothetical protein